MDFYWLHGELSLIATASCARSISVKIVLFHLSLVQFGSIPGTCRRPVLLSYLVSSKCSVNMQSTAALIFMFQQDHFVLLRLYTKYGRFLDPFCDFPVQSHWRLGGWLRLAVPYIPVVRTLSWGIVSSKDCTLEQIFASRGHLPRWVMLSCIRVSLYSGLFSAN